VAVRIVLIGIGRGCPASLAIEICCIRVTTAVDHLRRQTCEQRLCPFSPVQQMKLALRLCTDQNFLDHLVAFDPGVAEDARQYGRLTLSFYFRS